MQVGIKLVKDYAFVGNTVNASRAAEPKMISRRGRLWDVIGRTDGGDKIFADVSYGVCGYFQQKRQWYKFRLYKKP